MKEKEKIKRIEVIKSHNNNNNNNNNSIAKSSFSEALGTSSFYNNNNNNNNNNNSNNSISLLLLHLYQRYSEVKAGIYITGSIFVDHKYIEIPQDIIIEDKRDFKLLKEWSNIITKNSSLIIGQLSHPGRLCPTIITNTPIGPSNLSSPWFSIFPSYNSCKEMSITEIKDVIKKFTTTASILHEAGFSGIQIQAGSHHLIHQFLSPITNKRKDQYGGNLINRLKILTEILTQIRENEGDEFIISVQISFHHESYDYTPISSNEYLEIIDYLHNLHLIDLIDINIRQYPFYLKPHQLDVFGVNGIPKQTTNKLSNKISSSTSSNSILNNNNNNNNTTTSITLGRNLTHTKMLNNNLNTLTSNNSIDWNYLKEIYYKCQIKSCILMLTGRDGDYGTMELYQTFYYKRCCDIVGYTDIFYSIYWLQSKISSSSSSLNNGYTRWYMKNILGSNISLGYYLITYIDSFFFKYIFNYYLFRQLYCYQIIKQIATNSINIEQLNTPIDSTKGYVQYFNLFFSFISTFVWYYRKKSFYDTTISIFCGSLIISSILSILFVLWVLKEVSS